MKYKKLHITGIIFLFVVAIVGYHYVVKDKVMNIHIIKPEIRIIYEYVKNMNEKEYHKAFNNLADLYFGRELGEDIEDYSYVMECWKNIRHMKIIELIDKTDKQTDSRWIVNYRYIGEVYSFKVYYTEIEYELENDSITDLKNGSNYFKIVTVKKNKESQWKIGEMSSAEESWKE